MLFATHREAQLCVEMAEVMGVGMIVNITFLFCGSDALAEI